jgi:zinc-binding alcohol dehydrogenase family protein
VSTISVSSIVSATRPRTSADQPASVDRHDAPATADVHRAVDPTQFAELVALGRSGAVVVSKTVWMLAPADEQRSVRAVDLFVRSDADQLKELVARIDRGELIVDIAERVPLADLASVHARATAGTLSGKDNAGDAIDSLRDRRPVRQIGRHADGTRRRQLARRARTPREREVLNANWTPSHSMSSSKASL